MYRLIVFVKKLTADVQKYRGADFITDAIGHITCKRPLVIASHIEYGESSISIADIYVPTSCDHRAAVHPNVRWQRAFQKGARENCCVIELHQVGCFCHQSHI